MNSQMRETQGGDWRGLAPEHRSFCRRGTGMSDPPGVHAFTVHFGTCQAPDSQDFVAASSRRQDHFQPLSPL